MTTQKIAQVLKLVLALCLAAPLTSLQANDAHHPAAGSAVASAANGTANATVAATADLSEGEVRKIDKEQGKLTIKHGPLANLEMPPMTMVFRVKDPASLDKVAAGDKVRFRAEKIEGQYVVTVIEKK